ncbi:FAD-dependent oxidoreductase [Streptomyces sp. NA04227]|uniref:NAD(P)/FAD-dependent oxidoreductase n=1 Tax=Streptomyces sp. NA04227 TaxID=2742136 RepID=UPI001590D941|nr:FAD-dependent oxidoreductase [Streptomyces sp. NA04227]QKW09692.1 FAD-dependent oxidoreductase [Streptomyces sp. NA04227]
MAGPEHVVVVGASLGGMSLVQELRRLGHDGRVTVIGAEKVRAHYDRTQLSKDLLTGRAEPESLYLLSEAEVAALSADLRTGRRATGLRVGTGRACVTVDDGSAVEADVVVIATGSSARRPPFPADLRGVHVLRTMEDGLALRGELAAADSVVVLGAGFIGCEVAAAARALERRVTVVDVQPVPMYTALGPVLGDHFARLHQAHGTRFELGTAVDGLVGQERVTGVRLADGRVLDADLVVVGFGGVPETEWLQGSGVEVDNGVVCDDAGRTSVPGVLALGDAARWHSTRHGRAVRSEHWNHVSLQATVVAENIVAGAAAADAPSRLDAVPSFWTDQFGSRMQMVGAPASEDSVHIVAGTPGESGLVAVYTRDGRTTAAVAVDAPRALIRHQALVADGAPWPGEPADR